MTVSSTTLKNSYSGNGSTTAFAYNFRVFASSELKVYIRSSTGTETLKSAGTGSTNYAVTGVGAASGGTVTFVTAPASGETVVLLRDTGLTQNTDYLENDSFPANSHEEALDRLTHIVQELDEEVQRSVIAPITDPADIDMTLPPKDTRKGAYLAFNSTSGDPEAGASSDDVTTLAAVTTDIATLADIQDGTVATNAITISSANSANISTVAGISANVTTVAGISSDVTAVAGDATDIGVVSGISANVSTVAGISSNVTSVAGNATNVNKVAAVDGDVTKVADIDSDVTAVANIDSDVSAVENIAANVTTVAGVAANVTTVAGVASNVTTVAGVAANVTTVAGVAANVTTVAGVSSDVTTVAGISGDVSAVAAQVIGYDFSTTTAMADPGSGNVRFNNATLASVTAIALDDLDKNGVDQSAYIALFDDSTNTVKGTLVIRTAGGDVATFNITDLTDNTGWNQIAVTHVASSGTFSDGEDTFIGFTRAGDKGADGAGSGDVIGPGSATDNTVARFNSTTGKLLQGSGVTIDDSNTVGAASLTLTTDLAVAHGGTGASTFAANGVLFGNGTSAIGATAVGSANQVLTSNGAGAAPTFQDAGGGGFTVETAVAVDSGTGVTFTGIPSGVSLIIVTFKEVSFDNSTHLQVQIGDSGGIETSGYNGKRGYFRASGTTNVGGFSDSFECQLNEDAVSASGSLIITSLDPSSNTWTYSVTAGGEAGTSQVMIGGGSKSLSGTLTQLRVSPGSGNFDGSDGVVNIMYQ